MRFAATVALAALAALGLPVAALAHPLGNFTINHYAGLEVSSTEIRLDVVVDRAEIPTFQERVRLDADEDGMISDAEIAAAREPECRALAPSLELTIDGVPAGLALSAAGLSFPHGAGGLPTMRLVCGFVVPIEGGVGAGRDVAFRDRSEPARLGWREVVVVGNGVTVSGPDLLTTSPSARLTAYPVDRLEAPLAITEVAFGAVAGGPAVVPFVAPDAAAIGGAASPSPAAARDRGRAPGGIARDVPEIFQATDVTPGVLLVALLTAVALGAGHALTPGHGKTLMAAYLVGARGTAVHAAGLGLSVAIAHTLGILGLAMAVALAGVALPPDVVVRWLPGVAAVAIVAIGAWMLAGEIRRRRHPSTHGQHEHQHHPGSTISWRSLFAVGLAGGIVPSTSALVILLGSIAAGRPAFGVVLVVAFGTGMAAVMTGIGLALVLGRGRLNRLGSASPLRRLTEPAPLVAAGLVLVIGLWLAGQALVVGPSL